MRIYIGSDHRGFTLKEKMKKYLREFGHSVTDLGNVLYKKNDDYPDFGKRVGEAVARDTEARGIVMCGSGVGICIAANRIEGARAVQGIDSRILKRSRSDDNTNILCLASDFFSFEETKKLVKIWLETPFQKTIRYKRRIGKLDK